MRLRRFALATAVLLITAGAAEAQSTHVPLDRQLTVGGVPVGCTGIGQSKNDPKWQSYDVRVEFAGVGGAYLANETLTLLDGGTKVLSVSCEGPWVLLRLPAGRAYQVTGAVPRGGAPKTMTVTAPSHGQRVFVLNFPVTE